MPFEIQKAQPGDAFLTKSPGGYRRGLNGEGAHTASVACPECKEGKLVERRNKRGQNFYGCSKFPECRYTNRKLPEENSQDTQGEDTNKTSEGENIGPSEEVNI